MGLLSFIKNAGSKLFGGKETEEEKSKIVTEHVNSFKLPNCDISVSIQGDTATLSGTAETQDVKNRAMAAAGNVSGVSEVIDNVTVKEPPPAVELEKQFYTVEKGDSLSKIAKAVYGDPMKYPIIFEANKPMLTNPDLIYPGQRLVIPVM
jgi:nucleoid-associated protein YgaU